MPTTREQRCSRCRKNYSNGILEEGKFQCFKCYYNPQGRFTLFFKSWDDSLNESLDLQVALEESPQPKPGWVYIL